MGFDYLMGTIYFPSIWDIVGKGANKKINYFPFLGKIYDRPSVLDGTIEEIVAEGKNLLRKVLMDLICFFTGTNILIRLML
ncbi:hypothetical protein LLG07_04400 [bacterium]|nr:hypothetical protein [bacterium]